MVKNPYGHCLLKFISLPTIFALKQAAM